MKPNFKLLILLAVISGMTLSCKKYLDVTPDNVATIDYAFRNRNEAENYLLPVILQYRIWGHPIKMVLFTTSGEIYFPNTLTEATLGSRDAEQGFHLIRGYRALIIPH